MLCIANILQWILVAIMLLVFLACFIQDLVILPVLLPGTMRVSETVLRKHAYYTEALKHRFDCGCFFVKDSFEFTVLLQWRLENFKPRMKRIHNIWRGMKHVDNIGVLRVEYFNTANHLLNDYQFERLIHMVNDKKPTKVLLCGSLSSEQMREFNKLYWFVSVEERIGNYSSNYADTSSISILTKTNETKSSLEFIGQDVSSGHAHVNGLGGSINAGRPVHANELGTGVKGSVRVWTSTPIKARSFVFRPSISSSGEAETFADRDSNTDSDFHGAGLEIKPNFNQIGGSVSGKSFCAERLCGPNYGETKSFLLDSSYSLTSVLSQSDVSHKRVKGFIENTGYILFLMNKLALSKFKLREATRLKSKLEIFLHKKQAEDRVKNKKPVLLQAFPAQFKTQNDSKQKCSSPEHYEFTHHIQHHTVIPPSTPSKHPLTVKGDVSLSATS